MESLVDFFELLVGDVGIDLGGSDGGMAQHRLDAPDIGAVLEEVSRKAMAESMRMDLFDDSGFGGIELDQSLDASRGEAEPFRGFKLRSVPGKPDKEGLIQVLPFLEIFFERHLGGVGDENHPDFASFATDTELAAFEVDLVPIDRNELRYPEAG